MKKFVSLLLSAVIIASMIPFAVTAANAAETTATAVSDEPVLVPDPTEPDTTVPETTAPETTQPVTTVPYVVTPNAPENFKVKETAADYIIIRWDKVKDATSYVISRADEKSNGKMGGYSVIKTIDNMDITAYKNTANITAGKVYKYKIVAKRTEGNITKTSASKTVSAMTKPTNVSKVKVAKRTTTSVTIKWSKKADATNYVIQRSDEGSNGKFSAYKTIKTAKKTTTAIENTGLKSGYIYKYKVKVKRTSNSVSNQSTGKTVTAVVSPAAPKKLINKKATTTKIKIAWSKVAKANKYEVYRKEAKTKYTKLTTTKSRAFVDSKVTTGKTYKYKVRGIRTVKGKDYKGAFKALKTTTAVNGVNGVTVKTYLKRGLFSWKPTSGASGYEIAVKKSNGKWLVKANTSYTNYLTGKLKTNKTYTFRLRSYKTAGGQKVYGSAKTFNVTASNTAYGKSVSGTWVEVCIETQQMFMYVNNKLYCKTPVITGYAYNSRRTTPGYHRVLSRKSPATLSGSYGGSSWNVTVSYWLGFTGDGQGIHDASWQPNFGGELYKNSSRGSHGCVNTPTSAVAKIYSKAYVGMPVIVY